MRERLTASFIAITLAALVGAGLFRSIAADDEVRAAESEDAGATAAAAASVVEDALQAGRPVDTQLLEPFATTRSRVTYADDGTDPVEVGAAVDTDGDEDITERAPVEGGGTVTVTRRHNEALEGTWGDATATLALFGFLAVLAGLLGYLVARNLSQPFRQLALAAAALGRGRLDLDLPQGGVPEARAIASALELSASQLRDRLAREREFGQHASHVLRTPLTSLGLHLEGLVADPELSPEAREAALACLKAVAQLNEVAGELVELSGRSVRVAGAAVPLRDLATLVAQRWADELDETDRGLTASVEGDIELTVTPGPVEQVLDLLLEDVVTRESGSVRLVFEGAANRLRVDVLCGRPDGKLGAPTQPVQDRVHAIVDALGGNLEKPADADVLRLHLPRR